jgi:hypothetical protein
MANIDEFLKKLITEKEKEEAISDKDTEDITNDIKEPAENEEMPESEESGDMGDTGDSNEEFDVGDSEDPMASMNGEDPVYEPKTPEDIGKVYELKKIYYRLVAIQDYLSDFSDERLYKVRSYLSEALELFLVVSKNMLIFKDDLDEIIVLFYKFLRIVYMIIRKYTDEVGEEDNDDADMIDRIKSIKKSSVEKYREQK